MKKFILLILALIALSFAIEKPKDHGGVLQGVSMSQDMRMAQEYNAVIIIGSTDVGIMHYGLSPGDTQINPIATHTVESRSLEWPRQIAAATIYSHTLQPSCQVRGAEQGRMRDPIAAT